MILDSFATGPLGANCTLIGDETSHEAMVIDPGDEVGRIHRKLEQQGLSLKHILLTHAHIDHLGAAARLKELTGASLQMHAADLPILEMMPQMAAWLGTLPPPVSAPDQTFADGDTVGCVWAPAQVLHTPGHTPGSVCFYFTTLGLVVAGDTLFAGSIGRTDLPLGNGREIVPSIMSKLMTLADQTQVICGHGPSTTIGAERRTNPYLR